MAPSFTWYTSCCIEEDLNAATDTSLNPYTTACYNWSYKLVCAHFNKHIILYDTG